jgi:hypothetical protein
MEEMEASQRDRHRDIVSCVRGHRIKASTNKPASAANANQKKKGKKKKKKGRKKSTCFFAWLRTETRGSVVDQIIDDEQRSWSGAGF